LEMERFFGLHENIILRRNRKFGAGFSEVAVTAQKQRIEAGVLRCRFS
jgi:hypothetical protein